MNCPIEPSEAKMDSPLMAQGGRFFGGLQTPLSGHETAPSVLTQGGACAGGVLYWGGLLESAAGSASHTRHKGGGVVSCGALKQGPDPQEVLHEQVPVDGKVGTGDLVVNHFQ